MLFQPMKKLRSIPKKNMNYNQAKRRYPNLNPFGDADRDGVKNMFDCRPFNKNKQDEPFYGDEKVNYPMELDKKTGRYAVPMKYRILDKKTKKYKLRPLNRETGEPI